MKWRETPFRHARTLFDNEEEYRAGWLEVEWALGEVTDEALIAWFDEHCQGAKSISAAINGLLKEKLSSVGWATESPIFSEAEYQAGTRWRLDFAKYPLSIEVAFNHGEAASWNLLKPVLASELNHVQKAIQTKAGIVITATQALKEAGGFDSAVGSYEYYATYLKPLGMVLTAPILLVGLDPPETFRIAHHKDDRGHLRGEIVRL